MTSVTHTSAGGHVERPAWRDAIKEDLRLTEHEAWVGILIADYWKTGSKDPLWVAMEIIQRQSRLSRTMVYRAIGGLVQKGYLLQVQKARPNLSPRWMATIPFPELCLEDTVDRLEDTEQDREDTRNPKHSTSTPDFGSSDLDGESRVVSAPKARDLGPLPRRPARRTRTDRLHPPRPALDQLQDRGRRERLQVDA